MKEQLVAILGEGYSDIHSFQGEGSTWCNAKDVCEVLGIRNRSLAVNGNVRVGYFGIEDQDVCKLTYMGKRQLYFGSA